jgi:type VI secretion system protein ImpL
MNRFWQFLFDARVLGVIGLVALACFLFLGAEVLKLGLVWGAAALGLALVVWAVVWLVRKVRAHKAAKALEQGLEEQASKATTAAGPGKRAEVELLRNRMQTAIKTIRTSKLGEHTGSAALYELPWYLVIGSPAAGKSTAIVKSGLNFPFADDVGNVVQGIGGTRNCDWFFTSEGILLDTAGRYSVHDEDRQEWLGFLSLLKRNRPKAPINGIIIAASAAELASGQPEQNIALAKNLRQRVQELTEHLEVFAPVYVVFTKADLIAGFAEFFEDNDRAERDRVWGATFPYERRSPRPKNASVTTERRSEASKGRMDWVSLFDKRFDELADGLKERSVAHMSLSRGQSLPPGVLTFPLEFAGLKPALRAFVSTLFEDNAFQFQPVFRGFYFTSSVQEGRGSSRASERVMQQFALHKPESAVTTGYVNASNGFFLKDLFTKVIFGDRELVRQHASRRKLRMRSLALGLGVAMMAVALAGWSWSWLGNRQLMASVRADLDKVVRLQAERTDLSSRMEALETLQDRIEQLQRWRADRPLGLTMGLYQGEHIERRLREEYFEGIKLVMLQPVSEAIESYLGEVNRDASRLQPMVRTPTSGAARESTGAGTVTAATASAARFVDASPEDSSDAYNALKTYLMLGDRTRLESGHLNDQITRFWRGWLDDNRGTQPRELLMRSAERLISFTTSNLADPAFPQLANQLALVDTTRQNLREVARGVRGVERVYADIKTRAATRFPPITVAGLISEADKGTLAGSYAVPGTFTREAWDDYIEKAFKEAATSNTENTDWVLKISNTTDITLDGSPEQIRKQLTEMYKTEYVAEWRKFMQGVTVAEFSSFELAAQRMNRLGDVQNSPLKLLMQTLFDQTSWDNPSLLNERLATTQRGFMNWFKQTILRQAPSRVEVNVNLSANQAQIPLGPIGREFAPLARIMMSRDNNPAPMNDYLAALGKVRTRLNQIRTQGDPGPGARALVGQTLEGSAGELTEALRLVDERMLQGMSPTAREALRPVLVRPLTQTMAALVPAAETELNRQWASQVYDPFVRTLAPKFPFDPASRVEATPADMAKIFGATGAIAKFGSESMSQIVNNRGNALEARTWGDVGVRLKPAFAQGYPTWVSVQELQGSAGGPGPGGTAAPPPSNQTVFEVLAQGAPDLTEYTLVIDGQTLRHRNAAAQWVRMVWPNPGGTPGVRLDGVTNDGQTTTFVNEAGNFGLQKLFDAAKMVPRGEGVTEMTWRSGNASVSIHLRLLSKPGATGGGAGGNPTTPGTGLEALRGVRLPATVVGDDATDKPVTAAAAASAAGARR